MTENAKRHGFFDAKSLLDKSRQITGLSDFGDQNFRVGLDRFLAGLTEEGQPSLTAIGVSIMDSTIVRFLVNRLRFEADLHKHPEILEEVILPPIVIMGLPRSGTTKLQRMMASDNRLQSLRTWQIMNPAPFPDPLGPDGRDSRIAAAEEVDRMVDAIMPELRAGHDSRSEDVDEEAVTLMEMDFDYLLLAIRIESPAYEAWVKTRPVAPVYRNLRRWLQYLQWQQGGADKPYLLKGPLHLSSLDALLEVFPGATLVHCHRDPKQAVTSFMRLAEIPRSVLYGKLDPHRLGTWMLNLMAELVEKHLSLRQALTNRVQIVDVAFRDINSNPLLVMEQIYAQRDVVLPPDTRRAMLTWERAHPSHAHGKFHYDMAHYGKTPEDFDLAFSKYMRTFAALL